MSTEVLGSWGSLIGCCVGPRTGKEAICGSVTGSIGADGLGPLAFLIKNSPSEENALLTLTLTLPLNLDHLGLVARYTLSLAHVRCSPVLSQAIPR